MSIKVNGTNITDVVYNGVDCEKVIFNGTTVFLKGIDIQDIKNLTVELKNLYNITDNNQTFDSVVIKNIHYDNGIFIIYYYYYYTWAMYRYYYHHVAFSKDLITWQYANPFNILGSSTTFYPDEATFLCGTDRKYYIAGTYKDSLNSSRNEYVCVKIFQSENLIDWNQYTQITDSNSPLCFGDETNFSIQKVNIEKNDYGIHYCYRKRDDYVNIHFFIPYADSFNENDCKKNIYNWWTDSAFNIRAQFEPDSQGFRSFGMRKDWSQNMFYAADSAAITHDKDGSYTKYQTPLISGILNFNGLLASIKDNEIVYGENISILANKTNIGLSEIPDNIIQRLIILNDYKGFLTAQFLYYSKNANGPWKILKIPEKYSYSDNYLFKTEIIQKPTEINENEVVSLSIKQLISG